MNPKTRIRLMLLLLVVLLAANLYYRLGDDSIDRRGLFGDETDLTGSYTGKLKKTIEDLNALPLLSFRVKKEDVTAASEADRNPFIMGVDRALERRARERMAAAARTRAATVREEAVAPPPEPPKPSFPGRVLGLMHNRQSGVTQVSIALAGEYFILSQGETFDNRFRLISIEGDRVKFLSLADNEEIAINLE